MILKHSYLIFLMLISCGTWAADQRLGLCSRKLKTSNERDYSVEEFKSYLGLLLEERILTYQDLNSFLSDLTQGKLSNPIPHTSNKQFALHHKEFGKLIAKSTISPIEIQNWLKNRFEQLQVVELEKASTAEKTKETPIYVAPNGAMFFKINHPRLGEAVRILKPKGNISKSEDWEPIVWAIHTLKDQHKKTILFKNTSALLSSHKDPKNQFMVSPTSPARRACLDLGEKIDLPSHDEYASLLSFFEQTIEHHPEDYSGRTMSSVLTPKGLMELEKVFGTTREWGAWTSSTYRKDYASFYMGLKVHSDYFGKRSEPRPSRCVERGLRAR